MLLLLASFSFFGFSSLWCCCTTLKVNLKTNSWHIRQCISSINCTVCAYTISGFTFILFFYNKLLMTNADHRSDTDILRNLSMWISHHTSSSGVSLKETGHGWQSASWLRCSPLQSLRAGSLEFRSQEETAGIVICGSQTFLFFFSLQPDKVSSLWKKTTQFTLEWLKPVKHNRKPESPQPPMFCYYHGSTHDLWQPQWKQLNPLLFLSILHVTPLVTDSQGFHFFQNYLQTLLLGKMASLSFSTSLAPVFRSCG